MSDISIIGGGPAGLAVAYYASINEKEFEIFEANTIIGGNCITIKKNNFYFDSGAHRLHDVDSETTDLFKKILKKDLKKIDISSQIYFKNQFIDFPISPINLVKFLGIKRSTLEGVKILFNNLKTKKISNFQTLVEKKYGKYIANLFLINYSEKLWGTPANKLSITISGKRLKGLNLLTLIIELIFGKQKKTRHLDGSFYYPKFGIGTLFDNLALQLDYKNINLNSTITKVYHENFKVKEIEINNKNIKKIKQLVTTIPIDIFIKQLSPSPPKKIINLISQIKYRNVILIAFFINKKTINSNGSMYFPSKKFPFTRIYEPRNRSNHMSPKNKTSLIVELPCFKEDKYWNYNENEISLKIEKQLIALNLFEKNEVIQKEVYKIKNAYPVLENDIEKKLKPITDYLSKFTNLKSIGRNGLFAYSHIHDQFISARKIFKEIKN